MERGKILVIVIISWTASSLNHDTLALCALTKILEPCENIMATQGRWHAGIARNNPRKFFQLPTTIQKRGRTMRTGTTQRDLTSPKPCTLK